MLHYQKLLYTLEIIKLKFLSRYYNDLLINYLEVEKTCKIIAKKYSKLIFYYNIKKYV